MRQVAADRRLALPLIACLLVVALVTSACGGAVQEAPGDAVGQEAPEGNPGSTTGQGESGTGVVEGGDNDSGSPAPNEALLESSD